ncbi:bacteriohemerythrin [Pseudomonas sp. F1_0610]|uniref:bacteriohemerythrin n=1 Tax=Pseudomonas sp. F1_0610 TaxID=3114284 RepID=UPI0039C106FB
MAVLDLTWSDEYVLGIDVVDQQHRQLFTYFKEIDDAIAARNAQEVEIVVNGLVNYAISHNTFEESLMEQANYPLLEAHHKIHESFKKRAMSYLDKLNSGADPFKIAEQVRIYIGLWLVSHVKHEDRDYVPYVKKITKKSGVVSSLLGRFFR